MATRPLAAALLVLLIVVAALPAAAAAPPRAANAPDGRPPDGSPKVAVSLISEPSAIEPGATMWVGLHQRIARGWHTYWINPGDSGEPPTIAWSLPAGFTAGPIVWPQPERLPQGPVMSYGYTGEVVLLARITAPPELPAGQPVTLRGRASWLVCEKICIPEEADVALTLPVAAAKPPAAAMAPAIERARRSVPAASPWPVTLRSTAETVTVTVAAPGVSADRIEEVWFVPMRWGVIDHAAPQAVSIDAGRITLRTARGPLPEAAATDVDGVLVIRERLDQGTVSQAFAVRAVAGGAPGGPGAGSLTLIMAMALALAGGLILNLMPCVLPVLSVKAIALIEHSEVSPRVSRRHGLAYTAGVLASFAVLAGALIALRAGGAEIGWGFQLQSPVVVTLLAYVLFALALSLS
ncbi:MAG TPA: protein-disulfide reductase DsbD domain-containing protein, partial [Methylomirabilota bacterium]